MHEIAQDFFQKQLRSADGVSARAYLEKRGMPPETQDRFGLGYAPGSGNRLLRVLEAEGFPADQLEPSGLVAKNDEGRRYDRFRDRLMFPIHNESGKVIAFAGRALQADAQPKYLNSPETPIYKKSFVLYNLHRAKETVRREQRAVLVEGYMDVIGLDRAAVDGSVASCGTALTPQQVRMLRRYAETVVVNFDPDQAGQNATERSIQLLLEEGIKVRVLALPDGLDPDEFCGRHGGERYRALLDSAADYFIWLADRARRQFDMRTAEGRVAAFQFLVPSVNLLRDEIQRVAIATELVEHLRLDHGQNLVAQQFVRAAAKRHQRPLQEPVVPEGFAPGEGLLLRCLLQSEQARLEMLDDVVALATEQDIPSRRILEAMKAVVREETFHYGALEGRLEEKDRELLSKLVFGVSLENTSLEEAREFFNAMRRQAWLARQRALLGMITEAEKKGDHAQAIELLHRKKALEEEGREIGCLRPLATAVAAAS
jgi:DNA primase